MRKIFKSDLENVLKELNSLKLKFVPSKDIVSDEENEILQSLMNIYAKLKTLQHGAKKIRDILKSENLKWLKEKEIVIEKNIIKLQSRFAIMKIGGKLVGLQYK